MSLRHAVASRRVVGVGGHRDGCRVQSAVASGVGRAGEGAESIHTMLGVLEFKRRRRGRRAGRHFKSVHGIENYRTGSLHVTVRRCISQIGGQARGKRRILKGGEGWLGFQVVV